MRREPHSLLKLKTGKLHHPPFFQSFQTVTHHCSQSGPVHAGGYSELSGDFDSLHRPFLASAEAYRVPVCLVFNKVDRYTEEELHYLDGLTNLYTHIGYPCYRISALDGTGVDEIKQALEGKVTLFSGHSGVGKSTLINAILPEQNVKTGEISTAHNKGMHTTTFSEMFPVASDGYIIDTPGIKGFGTFDMKDEEVGHYFKEIFEFSAQCKYGNCTHRHEPGCAVREAVENHYISESRYTSYLNILEDKEEGKYRSAY